MKGDAVESTKQALPSIWLKLHFDLNKESEQLSLFLSENNIACDLSTQPSLWGHILSKWTGPCMIKGNFDYENVLDSQHAHDLITAHLLQSLCSIGRSSIDLFVLPVRKEIPYPILQGIKETVQQAKEENLIRYFGVALLEYSEQVLSMTTFYDFANALIIPEDKVKNFENFNLKSLNVFYESSSFLPDLNSNLSQLITVKNMKEIYSLKQHLEYQKESL